MENQELRIQIDENTDEQKDIEIQNLIHDNTILNEECIRLREECEYLAMKENKLRYFYDTLNSTMYPIQEIYENTFKNIPTTRFYEFLESQNKAPNEIMFDNNLHDYHNQGLYNQQPVEPIKKSDYSFDSDFSYEPLVVPNIKNKPRPSNVPELNFEGLPEYETSSDEEDDNQHQNMQYHNNASWLGMVNTHTNSMKDSNFELSKSSIEGPLNSNMKKSAMYSKSNQRSSSIDFKMSESF